MKIDLNSESEIKKKYYDVCVIGTGAVGSYVCSILSSKNFKVCAIDIGNLSNSKKLSQIMSPIYTSEIYGGTESGREFCLGGTSTKWGGVLIPHSVYDFNEEDFSDNMIRWNKIVKIVYENSEKVLKDLNINSDLDFFQKFNDSAQDCFLQKNNRFKKIISKTLPFQKRNLIRLINSKKVDIFYNCYVNEWHLKNQNSEHVIISSTNLKNKCSIISKIFIITSGAIESTRILLELDEQHSHKLFSQKSNLGYFLGDHLSVPIAKIREDYKFLKNYTPEFNKGVMRNSRFVLDSKDKKNLPNFFAHFVFDIKNKSFDRLRNIGVKIQKGNIDILSLLDPKVVRYLIRYGYSRYFSKKLYIPKDSKIRLQVDFEQERSIKNHIKLSKTELDSFGRKKLLVDWSIRDRDLDNYNKILAFFNPIIKNNSSFMSKIQINKNDFKNKVYDAYHPVGTCTFGNNENDVLDNTFKVKNTDNIFSLSTAVLPSAGTANPTFSLLCLGNQLSKYVIEKLNG